MTSTLKMIGVAALAIVIGAGAAAQAEAAPIVSISPVSQTVDLNDPVAVDIIVSGLDAEIGGFSAVLSFDTGILTGVDYVLDPQDKFDGELDLSFGFTGGDGSPLDLFLAGDPDGTQGTGFTLATVNFTATGFGLTNLTLSGVVLSSATGGADILPGVANGSVCVATATAPNPNCARVPEPGLLALVGAGLGALGVRRRKAAASRA